MMALRGLFAGVFAVVSFVDFCDGSQVVGSARNRVAVAAVDAGNNFYVLERNGVEEQFGGRVYKTLSAETCATPFAAAQVAERIFKKIYGEGVVRERPWCVAETGGCYIVTGSLPKGFVGGVAQLKLRKKDGQVWVFYHGK